MRNVTDARNRIVDGIERLGRRSDESRKRRVVDDDVIETRGQVEATSLRSSWRSRRAANHGPRGRTERLARLIKLSPRVADTFVHDHHIDRRPLHGHRHVQRLSGRNLERTQVITLIAMHVHALVGERVPLLVCHSKRFYRPAWWHQDAERKVVASIFVRDDREASRQLARENLIAEEVRKRSERRNVRRSVEGCIFDVPHAKIRPLENPVRFPKNVDVVAGNLEVRPQLHHRSTRKTHTLRRLHVAVSRARERDDHGLRRVIHRVATSHRKEPPDGRRASVELQRHAHLQHLRTDPTRPEVRKKPPAQLRIRIHHRLGARAPDHHEREHEREQHQKCSRRRSGRNALKPTRNPNCSNGPRRRRTAETSKHEDHHSESTTYRVPQTCDGTEPK